MKNKRIVKSIKSLVLISAFSSGLLMEGCSSGTDLGKELLEACPVEVDSKEGAYYMNRGLDQVRIPADKIASLEALKTVLNLDPAAELPEDAEALKAYLNQTGTGVWEKGNGIECLKDAALMNLPYERVFMIKIPAQAVNPYTDIHSESLWYLVMGGVIVDESEVQILNLFEPTAVTKGSDTAEIVAEVFSNLKCHLDYLHKADEVEVVYPVS